VDNLNDERVMTAFLLGRLAESERTLIEDRLADDAAYFESMAALEDDLIVRWHRRGLSPDDRASFARAYLSVPARRARVEAEAVLLDAVSSAQHVEPPRTASDETAPPAPRWWTGTVKMPRYALVAASAALVAATGVMTTLVVDRRQSSATGQHVIGEFPLTAVAERGTGSTRTMDRVRISPDTDEVRLVVDLDPAESGPFEVVLEAVDGQRFTPPPPPRVDRRATVTEVSVTMAPDGLSNGDYVLRVQRPGQREPDVVARRAFRVWRGD
jgi:hypothetical protein